MVAIIQALSLLRDGCPEGYKLAGVPPDDPMLVLARGFIERCQNFGAPGDDGGFFFSPRRNHESKGG